MGVVCDGVIADWIQRADEAVARGGDGILKADDGTAGVDQAAFLPTPEEIAEACMEIRREWSDEERQKRLAVKAAALTVPSGRRMRPARKFADWD